MPRSTATAILFVAILAASPVSAQHAGHQAAPRASDVAREAGPAQPYAGLERRRVKALSEAKRTDLLAGRGMALALAAELNGYPGPLHVLEHAEALGLTPAQRAAAEALRARMGEEARAIGARLVVLEEELDDLFASGNADVGRLTALTSAIGALGGRLRETHLAAHIGMREVLEPSQRDAYARLRGYTAR